MMRMETKINIQKWRAKWKYATKHRSKRIIISIARVSRWNKTKHWNWHLLRFIFFACIICMKNSINICQLIIYFQRNNYFNLYSFRSRYIYVRILIHCNNAISILYWTEKRLKLDKISINCYFSNILNEKNNETISSTIQITIISNESMSRSIFYDK